MTCRRAIQSYFLNVISLLIAALLVLLVLIPLDASASNPTLFLPPITYGTGGFNPVAVTVADVNGDGNRDLIVANQCSGSDFCVGSGSVSVLLGDANGSFQAPLSFASGGSFLYSVAVADVNADGKPDLVLANGCANIGGGSCSAEGAVGVLLGNGDGTFQAAVTYPSGGFAFFSSHVEIADVNSDGKPDLVVLNGCSSVCDNIAPPEASVAILTGNGDGTFNSPVSYLSGGYFAFSLTIADLNGDGNPDVVVANWCSDNTFIGSCFTQAPIGVLIGNGDGSFQPAVAYGSGGEGGRSVAVADVNADGKPDLLTGNCGTGGCSSSFPPNGVIGVLLGNGDGTFQPAAAYGSGSYMSLTVADVDGDNKPDVLAASLSCAITGGCAQVLFGNGSGSFQTAASYDLGIFPFSIATADLNRDGALDVVLTHEFGNGLGIPPGEVDVLLNNSQSLDRIPPVITLSVTPKVLWPPKGNMLPVTISGTIIDTGSGVNLSSAAYFVTDEYGLIQPTGSLTLGAGGSYSFTVLLQASRRGSDLNGRQYSITVRASDNAGNAGSKSTVVTVPHDRGN
jgi:hypothetical protein